MSLPVTGEEKTQMMQRPVVVPLPGQRIADKYVVERVIGVGGMAVVLAARHVHLDQRVAIKMLLPEYARDGGTVARFLREGQAVSRIHSEHVVRVHDVGILEGEGPYLALELLEGRDLGEVVAAGRLPIAVAVDYVLQACEAVAEAHALGIIHRDLKPSNLFLSRLPDGGETIKVLDFGISKVAPTGGGRMDPKLTQTGALLGTPAYMAPEQMRGLREVDARTDIWGLGSILYELCAGGPPFTGESMAQLAAAVMSDPVPQLHLMRTDAPAEIDTVLERCLQKRPEDRYASLAELAQALAPLGTPAARISLERIVRVLGPRLDASSPSLEGSVRLASSTTLGGLEKQRPSSLRWVVAVSCGLGLGALAAVAVFRVGATHATVTAPVDPSPASTVAALPEPTVEVVAPTLPVAPAEPPKPQATASAELSAAAPPPPAAAPALPPVKAPRAGQGGKKPFIASDRGK
jgi:serine/threonine-protein kinase